MEIITPRQSCKMNIPRNSPGLIMLDLILPFGYV